VTCTNCLEIELKVTKFQSGLTLKEFLEFLLSLKMDRSFSGIENPTPLWHWKGYDDGWWVTEKSYSDIALKKLWWQITDHWKAYSDVALKRIWWRMMSHWKAYSNMSLKSYGDTWRAKKATMMCHYKGYSDGSLKRLLWCVTKKATMTGEGALKILL
jgi:hypothetical protein